uniref:Disease resistance N-terminal domain-containing protein n=3 Tax=Aegilops tauschii subsp. strangulata TaxID=200361 RepID=A0A453T9V5_AEGTS
MPSRCGSPALAYHAQENNHPLRRERDMADLVVGLAKSVVEGALTKAQAAIEEEAKLRQSTQRNLVFITDEFEMMHSFLKVADEERLENKVVITWVRQIRELAYDVEDCIELVIHLDKKSRWWWHMVPSWCMALPLPLDEAASEIEQLKARVEDVSTRNTRYSLISDT